MATCNMGEMRGQHASRFQNNRLATRGARELFLIRKAAYRGNRILPDGNPVPRRERGKHRIRLLTCDIVRGCLICKVSFAAGTPIPCNKPDNAIVWLAEEACKLGTRNF